MKCQCLCREDGNEYIQFKLEQDDHLIIQANKSNSQINICKIQGDQYSQSEFPHSNSLVQLMDKIQNWDKSTIHQMIEISAKSQNFHKLQEDTCCKILNANLLRCNCSCGEPKKPKKQKQKLKQSPKKEVIPIKKDSSDLKTQKQSSKVQQQVNEDIRNFEDKIKMYTSEIDESQKIIPNISQDWIKRLGTQKKKK